MDDAGIKRFGAFPSAGGTITRLACAQADPREEVIILGGPCLNLIGEYQKTLEKYPNPGPINIGRRLPPQISISRGS